MLFVLRVLGVEIDGPYHTWLGFVCVSFGWTKASQTHVTTHMLLSLSIVSENRKSKGGWLTHAYTREMVELLLGSLYISSAIGFQENHREGFGRRRIGLNRSALGNVGFLARLQRASRDSQV